MPTQEELQAQLEAANERLRVLEAKEKEQERKLSFNRAITEFNLSDKGIELLRSTGLDSYDDTKKWIDTNKDKFGDIVFKTPLASNSQPTVPGKIEQIDPSKKPTENKEKDTNPNSNDYWLV